MPNTRASGASSFCSPELETTGFIRQFIVYAGTTADHHPPTGCLSFSRKGPPTAITQVSASRCRAAAAALPRSDRAGLLDVGGRDGFGFGCRARLLALSTSARLGLFLARRRSAPSLCLGSEVTSERGFFRILLGGKTGVKPPSRGSEVRAWQTKIGIEGVDAKREC